MGKRKKTSKRDTAPRMTVRQDKLSDGRKVYGLRYVETSPGILRDTRSLVDLVKWKKRRNLK